MPVSPILMQVYPCKGSSHEGGGSFFVMLLNDGGKLAVNRINESIFIKLDIRSYGIAAPAVIVLPGFFQEVKRDQDIKLVNGIDVE